ncbi:MAG: DUF4395 domain-containing protein [Herpetosiphon sp.]
MNAMVDRSALRANQACIVVLALVAFVLGSANGGLWVVLAVGLILLVGTVIPAAGLFKLFYRFVLRPLGVMRPHVIVDDPHAHLFAQGIGAACMLLGFAGLLVDSRFLGWGMVWLVIALATVNLLFDFCAGCFVYFQLQRRGLLRGKTGQD